MAELINGIPNVLLVGAIALGAYSIYEGIEDSDEIDDEQEEE